MYLYARYYVVLFCVKILKVIFKCFFAYSCITIFWVILTTSICSSLVKYVLFQSWKCYSDCWLNIFIYIQFVMFSSYFRLKTVTMLGMKLSINCAYVFQPISNLFLCVVVLTPPSSSFCYKIRLFYHLFCTYSIQRPNFYYNNVLHIRAKEHTNQMKLHTIVFISVESY